MTQQEIQTEVERIIDANSVGTMATIQGNKPHTRYMTFSREGLTLYTATDKNTHKVEELTQNPYTHILIGYDGKGIGDEYVDYEGDVRITDSEELRKKLWNSDMEQWFNGPDDPNYTILEITPVQIKLLNKNDLKPRELGLNN